MKIEVLSQNDKELKFSVKGISYAFANELRRIMVSEVPTMAIEWVDFKKNDSAIPDELLSNRLGQVPLTFDKKAYNIKETCDNCKGKGCSRCQVELVLKKKGPGMVYSGDLKSKAKDVQPVFDKIPLVEIFEGHELQFEAIAQLGRGRNHAKWQAAVVGYKYEGDNFIFNVESVSGLQPDEIVMQAVDSIEDKAAQFGKLLGKLE
jgi:DNA-directed RNA polymerase subunit D